MSDEAKDSLMAAARAVSTAIAILKMEMPTIDAFLKESRDMDNFGHVVDPTLWMSSERRAADAVVKPLFEAAVAFVKAYDAQVARSSAALKKVME